MGSLDEKQQAFFNALMPAIFRGILEHKSNGEMLASMLGSFALNVTNVQRLLQFIQTNVQSNGKPVDVCMEYLTANGAEPLPVQFEFKNALEEFGDD